MHSITKEYKNFLYFITFVTFLRLLLASHVGLGVDEAHYVLYGKYLSLSYFDHPPLVGWVQYLFTSIFGINEFGSRVGAILIGFFVSIFLYKLIYQLHHNPKEAFLGVLALHASFLFNALFLMLLPDTLLFLLIIPIIFTVINLERNPNVKNWLYLGILLGLSGLGKYTAILFVIPIVLYLLIKKRFDLFLDKRLFLAIFVALFIISPVIMWNIQNDWISFTYQSKHVVGSQSINWSGFFTSIASQFGAYNPFLMPLAFFGLYKAIKSKNDTIFLSSLFGLVLISFFTYASLYKPALPHWSALFYMIFIPLGVVYLKNKTRYIKFAIGFGLILSIIAYSELGFKYIPQKDYQSLHRDIYGWDKIMQRANKLITNPNKQAIAVLNWTLASRAMFYNLPYKSDVFLLDNRYDQFDIWQKKSPIGKDMIIINTKFFHKDLKKHLRCKQLIKKDSFDIMLNKNKVNTVELFACKDYQGLK